MLYAGPVVLRNSIPVELYDNFTLFSAAMHLLLSPGTSDKMVDCAHEFLVAFVSHFGQIYGRQEITYNVHQLTHLAEEYRLFGPLDNISAFPFENYLGQIKHLLRKPHLPLQQVVKRLSEIPDVEASQVKKAHKFMHLHCDGPLVPHIGHGEQYTKVIAEKYTLSVQKGDNCVQILDDIVIVCNIVNVDSDTLVIFQRFKESFFQYPLPSSSIGCYRVWDLSNGLGVFKLQRVHSKYFLCPDKTGFIAMPFTHSQ